MITLDWIIIGSSRRSLHIAMIGMISQQNKKEGLPVVNIPEGDYGSFRADVTKDGYKISYKANDPKTAYITKDVKEKGGFLESQLTELQTVEEYFMDGKPTKEEQ